MDADPYFLLYVLVNGCSSRRSSAVNPGPPPLPSTKGGKGRNKAAAAAAAATPTPARTSKKGPPASDSPVGSSDRATGNVPFATPAVH